MRFKAIAGKPQSGVAIPVPTSLIWLSGFLGCVHIASLITITLVLVICPAHVEPREFGNSLAPERFMSQPPASLPPAFYGRARSSAHAGSSTPLASNLSATKPSRRSQTQRQERSYSAVSACPGLLAAPGSCLLPALAGAKNRGREKQLEREKTSRCLALV